jgi:hypothetical protein
MFMKKSLIFVVSFFIALSVSAQETITLSQTNATEIWSVVKIALQERSVTIVEFNTSTGFMQSNYYEYSNLLTKNRFKYKITLTGSTLTFDMTDREYSSKSGWVPNLIPVNKSAKEKFLTSLVKRVEEISKSQQASEKPIQNTGSQNAISLNGITMNIQSTRIIGNKVMVSGQFVSDRVIRMKFLNPVKAMTSKGVELITSQGTWAGEDIWQLYAVDQELQPEIPVSFNIMFDNKDESVDILKIFSVKLYSPENTTFIFHDIQIPMQADPDLTPGSIQIYKDVYMKFKKQDDTGGHLKIYFTVENKSGRERAVFLETGNLIDASGNSYPNPEVYIGGEKEYAKVNVSPDAPISGYFDFTGNISFSSVKLLQFETKDYAKFSVKQIVLQP